MSKKAFETIKAGLLDAIAHAQGQQDRARLTEPRRPDIDAHSVRTKLGLTQAEFAKLCGVSIGTVRNWEQGRRRPTGPSRALLHLVNSEPEAALRVMQRKVA